MAKKKTKLCKRCGAQMRLLDENEQLWYCSRDDLFYLGNQGKWSDEKNEKRTTKNEKRIRYKDGKLRLDFELHKPTINGLGHGTMYLAVILGILYMFSVGIASIFSYGIVVGRVLLWFLVLLIIFVLGYFLNNYHRHLEMPK
jgi:hypothetical protein